MLSGLTLGQVKGYGRMLKLAFVRAIAEGLVFRQAAPTKRHYRSAFQAVDVAVHIFYFEVALNSQGAVGVNRNGSICHREIVFRTNLQY
jgi:hypothetical protein